MGSFSRKFIYNIECIRNLRKIVIAWNLNKKAFRSREGAQTGNQTKESD